MGLIAHNKKFLHLTTVSPDTAHNILLLSDSALFKDNQAGSRIQNKSIVLGNFGEILLGNISDTAFPRLGWLLKSL